MKYQSKILDEMVKLHTTFCFPSITLDKETGEIDWTFRWINQEAEKTFNAYQELFHQETQRRLNEQAKRHQFFTGA